MITAFTCLLFPLLGECAPFVDYAPLPGELLRNTYAYAGKPVVVTGNVRTVRPFGASLGLNAQTFYLCDRRCVHVFIRDRMQMYEGERVSVRGIFRTINRVSGYVFRNDIEAAEVLPRI